MALVLLNLIMFFLNSAPLAPGLRLALTSAACLALCASQQAWAADDDALAPMVVTATRTPTRVSDVVADVTVIDRAQIEQAAGRSLASLLSDVPGVQMASNGGLGNSSSLFVRGGDFKQTLLLIDGVRYGSATLGTPVLDNIPLNLIDHIEVVRGPLASLYGADAASGVIQIFTRKGDEGFHPSASVTLGSNRFNSVSAGFSGGQDRLSYSLNANTVGTSGISATNPLVGTSYNPDRDGFGQQALSATAGWALLPGWRLEGQLLRSNGVTHFDDGAGPQDTNTDLSTSVTGLSLTGHIGSNWRSTWRVSESDDVSDTAVANKAYNLGRFATRQTQLAWDNVVGTPIGQLLLAAETLKQDVGDSTLAYPVSSRTINAAVLGLTGSHGRHDWQLSTRQDNNSQFGKQTTGSAAYGLKLGQGWRLAGSMGTSFVAPSFNQLYYPGYGTPDLKPQHGFNKEINLNWAQADHELHLTRYDNRIHDFIQTDPTSSSNIDGVRLAGWTLAGSVKQDTPLGQAYASGSLDWLDAHNMADDSKLLRRADRFGTLRVGLQREPWTYEVSLKGSTGTTDYGSVHLTGYALWGASLRYAVARDWALALRADNIGNHAYQTIYGYNQPGSQFFVTLSYTPKAL